MKKVTLVMNYTDGCKLIVRLFSVSSMGFRLNKNIKKQLCIIVFFIIFPFFSLPVLFCELYNGKKYPLILLSIFMGCLSMFYFPFGDQYRYFTDFELAKFLSIGEKFDFDSIMIFKDLNIINVLVFLFAKANLTLELLRFFLTIVCCILFYNIYLDLRQRNCLMFNRKTNFIVCVIIFLSVPYFLINYGFRTGVGCCLITYAIYQLYVNKRFFVGVLFTLLAVCTHFMFIIHLFIFVTIFFTNIYLNRNRAILLSIVLLLSSMSVFTLLEGRFIFLDVLLNSYVYGDDYGAGSFQWFSSDGIRLMLNGVILLFVLFVVFFKLNSKGDFENILYLLFILCIFSIPFATLFQRIVRSTVPIVTLYLVLHFEDKVVNKSRFLILFLQFIAFFHPIWIHRNIYYFARLDKIIYSSLPSILTNHYDEKTVSMKVGPDGLWYD